MRAIIRWTTKGVIVLNAVLLFSLTVLDVDEKIAIAVPEVAPYLSHTYVVVRILVIFLLITGLIWLVLTLYHRMKISDDKLSCLGWEPCTRKDINRIQEIAEEHLPTVTSFENTLNAYNHNNKSVRKIVDTRNRKKSLDISL